MAIINIMHKLAESLVIERLSNFRKKYILDLTPEQEEGLKELLRVIYEEGKDVGIKTSAQIISNLVEDKMGENSDGQM